MKKEYPRYYLVKRSYIFYYIVRGYNKIYYKKKDDICPSLDFQNESELLTSSDFTREIERAELALMEF